MHGAYSSPAECCCVSVSLFGNVLASGLAGLELNNSPMPLDPEILLLPLRRAVLWVGVVGRGLLGAWFLVKRVAP